MRRPSSEAAPPVPPAVRLAPYSPAADGLRLRVHVTPRAGVERVGMVVTDGRTARLKPSGRAPAHEGEANAAVVALLARTLRLPKSVLSVAAGHTSREKTIAIRGDARVLAMGVEALLDLGQEGRP
jgi:uncharacterized protein YggU (UPF0235/DUF167 family)